MIEIQYLVPPFSNVFKFFLNRKYIKSQKFDNPSVANCEFMSKIQNPLPPFNNFEHIVFEF